MDKFFSPKSIAVIGASTTAGKVGYDIVFNLSNYGYEGKLYPVNPKGGEILGNKVYTSVEELPQTDLAVFAIPAKFVAQSLEECGKKGIKYGIIISADFRETGEEGAKREEEVLQVAKKYGIRIIGPNCLGVLNPHVQMNASFSDGMPNKGRVSLISQSGAMAVAFMDWAREGDFGFAKVVSLGNKADVNEVDLLEYFGKDEQTDIILIYLEDFKNGEKFLEIAKKVCPKKPTIIIKSGRSEAGSKAASSHTGALAGSDSAVNAALKQAGVIRVNTIAEMFGTAKVFANAPLMKGKGLAIVTNAGGPGIITTDAVENSRLELAKLCDETKEKLREVLPAAANVNNPVDVIGDAPASRYRDALDIILQDENVAGVVTILTPQTSTEEMETAKIILEMKIKYPHKTITSSFIGGEHVKSAVSYLLKHGVADFRFPENAVNALNYSYKFYQRSLETIEEPTLPKLNQSLKKEVETVSQSNTTDQPQMVSYDLSNRLLNDYDFPLPPEKVFVDSDEACKFANEIGYPVVLKIVSPQIVHKTDIGAVKVNISTDEDLKQAFTTIMENSRKHHPDAEIEGVLIQKMMKGGKEIIIGIKRDSSFGPMIVFGLGGIYANVFNDATFRIAPISEKEAKKMLYEIKAIGLLTGARGETAVDLDAIAKIIAKTSHLAAQYPEIEELDFNPVLAFPNGAFVADAKVMVK